MATRIKTNQYEGVRGGWLEVGEIDIDPSSIAAGAESAVTVSLSGAKVGDLVFVNPVSLDADLFPKGARISAADTLEVVIGNEGAAAVDGASRVWHYLLVHLS